MPMEQPRSPFHPGVPGQENSLPTGLQTPPDWNAKHLRLAIDAAGVALWSWDVETDNFTMDSRGFDLWDLSFTLVVKFEDLSSKIHPADRDRVREAFGATRGIVGPYEIDFRIMVGETVKWISARGQGSDADIQDGLMFGIFLDVTGRRQAEEGHELLAGEMSHRLKNLLSIAAALTTITSQSASSTEEMASELINKLVALGRAHDVVRPIPGQRDKGALLGDLLAILLAPYDNVEAFSGRIRISVPRMLVGEAGATSLALVIHELATNSVKYGALSAKAGTLDVSGIADDKLVTIVWTERGGPPVAVPDELVGFGSKLLRRSMTSQLNGSVEHNWPEDGAIITLKIDRARLTQSSSTPLDDPA